MLVIFNHCGVPFNQRVLSHSRLCTMTYLASGMWFKFLKFVVTSFPNKNTVGSKCVAGGIPC